MGLPKQKFREIVLLLLYSYDFNRDSDESAAPLIMRELKVSRKYLYAAEELSRAVISKFPELDALIQKTAVSYAFERIPHAERNILRLGIYELLYSPHVPGKVTFAEAVRLARKFASPESATFVNAVLDTIYHEVRTVSQPEEPQ
jgi:N utilization substance protein B